MENLIKKNDSFFVAGHNGMVGSAIVRGLKNKGYCDPKKGGILFKKSKTDLDLTSNLDVLAWFKVNRPKVVIISAAKVGGIYANYKYPYDFISENLKIEQNLIEAAWKYGTRRLLFLGSSCIYPKYSQLPIREEELLASTLEKTNEAYAIAKIAGIKLCEFIRRQYNFDAISLMPTNLYGPNDNYHPQNSHVMAALIRKFFIAKKENLRSVTCWGTGSVLREFMHVDDLADAVIFCLENWYPSNENAPLNSSGDCLTHLNVGTGKDISIKQLALKIAHYTNFKGEILWDISKPDGTPRKVLDTTHINSLGWKAKIKLDHGIKNTINNFDMSSLQK